MTNDERNVEPARPRAGAIPNGLSAGRLQLIWCFVIVSSFVIRPSSFRIISPAEMRKGAVCLRHFVRVFAFFDGVTLARGRIFDFLGERVGHGDATAIVGVLNDPTHRKRNLPGRRHFHWHLVGRATDATRFHFQPRANVLERFV